MSDYFVSMTFNDQFKGTLETNQSSLSIGMEQGDFRPYQLLFGALGSCFYATFLSVSKKMRLSFDEAIVTVDGKKRTTIPETLEVVYLTLTIKGGSDHEKLKKAAKLGADYCSIHETIKQVADINLEVIFTNE